MPMSRLRNGQPFPSLEVRAVGGGTIWLPDDLAGSYGVVLIYRGGRITALKYGRHAYDQWTVDELLDHARPVSA
jgi:hypothetical protein